jgi:hypothetical protein
MKYKKFILFQFDDHEPMGGVHDIQNSFDTLDEAIAAGAVHRFDNVEVVDRDTWEIVWEND